MKYILDEKRQPVPCDDTVKWGEWMEKTDRSVGKTEVGPFTVSTVFLGLDHGFTEGAAPILFETMVFHSGTWKAVDLGGFWGEAGRTSNWMSAEDLHKKTVELVSKQFATLKKSIGHTDH